MKLLTLNAHSLAEENYPQKLMEFISAVLTERPEVIALQEVNQSLSEAAALRSMNGYVPCGDGIVIRRDNHVYKAAEMLRERGLGYFWTWLPIKKGYDRFDEGIAVMSLSPILETDTLTVSSSDDYESWKTRKILGIRTESLPDEWFYSVHFGRWDDPDEPFRCQWRRTATHVHTGRLDCAWLMGDFNAPAEVRGESYDMIKNSYWQDTFELAQTKSGAATVSGSIDGWHDIPTEENGMRIDQIWCSKKAVITSSETVFNGGRYPVISDHFGVMVNYERSII